MRAVTNIEPMENGKNRIVVTELPYLVNKARLIEKIAELHGEILSKLTLKLQKQRSNSTVLLPSLEYVDAFCKGLNVKQYKIYNK